jgi:integrase/recombinase XerD
MNRTATIYKKVKVAGVWRYCPPVYGKNNKVRPNVVVVGGVEESHPEGNYYIQFYAGTKPVYENCGPDAADAVHAAERKELFMQADNAGLKVADPSDDQKLSIAAAVSGYLQEIEKDIVRGHKSNATLQLFRKTLTEFAETCARVYVQDLERDDMIAYQDRLLKRGLAKNTAGKNLRRLNSWYRTVMHLKLGDGLVTLRDEVKDIDTTPEVFEEEQLARFFTACSEWEHLLFSVFLESGFRMQEIMYLTWEDVKDSGELCVTPKTMAQQGFNFLPKTRECRQVPVSTDLINRLRAWQQNQKAGILRTGQAGSKLVFSNRRGNPHDGLLNLCKRIGTTAGLKQEDCWLHKFRATMATRWLRKADLVTVQYLLGHKDIASTQRYLAPVKNANLRDLANAMTNVFPANDMPIGIVRYTDMTKNTF